MKQKLSLILILWLVVTLCGNAFAQEPVPSKSTRSDAYYRQGYLYYQDGDFQSAEKEYNKAVTNNPKNAKAYYWLAKTQYELGKYDQAKTNVQKALKINRRTVGAPNLMRLLNRKAKDVAYKSKPKIKIESGAKERITLDLVDVPLAQALKLFSDESGVGIVMDKDVYGTITVQLKNATFAEALDRMLQAGDATYIQDGRVIRIIPSGDPPDIVKLSGNRYAKTFVINYGKASSLQSTLISLVPPDTKILVPEETNKLIVEGRLGTITRVGTLLKSLDRPPRQVLVEANIIQVNHSNASKLATNLQYTNPSNANEVTRTVDFAGDPTATTAQGFYYSVTSSDMQAVVQALQTKTGYNLLSSPKVLALDGEEAEIITGSRLGYKVTTVTTTGLMESIEFLDVGTKLTLTPSIKDDDHILLEIHPEISSGSIVDELPQKDSTETTTKLLVRDGQTIIIGGLIKDLVQDTVTGVPLLADIPFLGVLFRKTETTVTKNEFIILIRPRIVDAAFLAEMGTPASELNRRRVETKPSLPLGLVD